MQVISLYSIWNVTLKKGIGVIANKDVHNIIKIFLYSTKYLLVPYIFFKLTSIK